MFVNGNRIIESNFALFSKPAPSSLKKIKEKKRKEKKNKVEEKETV